MPRRYNLRKRDKNVKWIEDETLKDKEDESESEDEDYEPESETEDDGEFEDDEEDDEEDEEEEDDGEEEETKKPSSNPQTIQIPLPKNGRIKIEIDTQPDYEPEYEPSDEEEVEDEFMDYLMNKYVPPQNKFRSRSIKKSKDEPDSPVLELNDEEQDYYDDLSKSKQKKLNKQMKKLEVLISGSGVPYKFRVLDLPLADSIKAAVIKKIDILNEMGMDNSESYKLRTWIEGFMRIPFGTTIPLPVKIDDGPKPCADFLSETRKTLDTAVYGMNGAKTQIMQILAQWISNPSSVGNVIALKGPMGVGKTSFAKNGVANVLKRPFEFFSLGGATDSANFVGHSYTYEGSMWGRIADSLMNARAMNPVMYFDELDKVSTTPHGEEIVSMLIHLTDRSQNNQFHDRYFAGVDFDLSQCLFVFSFNDESKVHPILKDRMQVIQCSGYTVEEKQVILTQYVWPQILERIKLDGLTLTEEAVKYLITEFSREEEGVRTLIRAVESLVTRINLLRIADEETAKSYKFYSKITFPLVITPTVAQHLLQDLDSKPPETWRTLYT